MHDVGHFLPVMQYPLSITETYSCNFSLCFSAFTFALAYRININLAYTKNINSRIWQRILNECSRCSRWDSKETERDGERNTIFITNKKKRLLVKDKSNPLQNLVTQDAARKVVDLLRFFQPFPIRAVQYSIFTLIKGTYTYTAGGLTRHNKIYKYTS